MNAEKEKREEKNDEHIQNMIKDSVGYHLKPFIKSMQGNLEDVQLNNAAAQADILVLKKFEKELHSLKGEVLENDRTKDQATAEHFIDLENQMKNLAECQEMMRELHDDLQQYGRRDILEFWGIAQDKNEDTTYLILDFLNSILGLKLTRYDISVSHRQRTPYSTKDKSRNPDPIYVKLVNRFVKNDILYLKRKYMNRMKQTDVFILENLTQRRRELLAAAKEKLVDFKFVWVKEGNIFARKHSSSRVHKITNLACITKLSTAQV